MTSNLLLHGYYNSSSNERAEIVERTTKIHKTKVDYYHLVEMKQKDILAGPIDKAKMTQHTRSIDDRSYAVLTEHFQVPERIVETQMTPEEVMTFEEDCMKKLEKNWSNLWNPEWEERWARRATPANGAPAPARRAQARRAFLATMLEL